MSGIGELINQYSATIFVYFVVICIASISAALSLGAIFNYPELTPIGAVGLFSSNVGEKINEYFKNKYRWVNFVN